MTIIRSLTSLPHRGTGTPMEKKAADIIENFLVSAGAVVERQGFLTPKTYIWEVLWLTWLIAAGLVSIPVFSWFSVLLLLFCTICALLFLDWRASPLAFICPGAGSENIIGQDPPRDEQEMAGENPGVRTQLILMAHYDSAPVSLLYLPSMVKNFRSSLFMNLGLIFTALLVSIFQVLYPGHSMVIWAGRALALYFLIQGGITAFDYLRYGYTNGASDNATGTAAAMVTAMRLWKKPVPAMDVRLVLTGAEETGMTGAKHYFTSLKGISPDTALVLNFDSLGKGDLKIVTKTGSITTLEYTGRLVDAAIKTARTDSRFNDVKTASWHTGDFDTLWFARAGIPSLTLTAQDTLGAIPHLHRPEDVIGNVDGAITDQAIDFAETLVRSL